MTNLDIVINLHSTIFILKLRVFEVFLLSFLFTFYYIYIKTGRIKYPIKRIIFKFNLSIAKNISKQTLKIYP